MNFDIPIESAKDWIPIIAAMMLTFIAAGFDLKYMKIPNKLNLVGMVAGIAMNVFLYGLHGLVCGGLGILVGFAFILLYAFGVLGAGDVKLFMAVGACVGPKNCILVIAGAFVFGALVGIIVLLLRKNGKHRLMHLYRYFWLFAVTKKLTKYEVIDAENDAYFSFGACIAAGTVIFAALAYFM